MDHLLPILRQLVKDQEAKLKVINEENKELKDRCKNLEENLENERQEKNNLSEETIRYEKERNEFEERTKQLQNNLTELEEKKKELEDELGDQIKENKEWKSKVSKIMMKTENLFKSCKELSKGLKTVTMERDGLKKVLEDEKIRSKVLDDKVLSLEETVALTSKSLDEKCAEIHNFDTEKEEWKSFSLQTKSEAKELTDVFENICLSLENTSDMMEALVGDHQTMTSKISDCHRVAFEAEEIARSCKKKLTKRVNCMKDKTKQKKPNDNEEVTTYGTKIDLETNNGLLQITPANE